MRPNSFLTSIATFAVTLFGAHKQGLQITDESCFTYLAVFALGFVERWVIGSPYGDVTPRVKMSKVE